jgi:hypothetical protein
MTGHLDIVVLGLSLSSSWGNGHATTYRALLAGLAAEGTGSCSSNATCPGMPTTATCPTRLLRSRALPHAAPELFGRFARRLARADAVIVGSYVPEGAALIDRLLDEASARSSSTTSTRR